MNVNVRRDLVLGGTVVAFGLGLFGFAFFAADENFRAPRWVVAAAAAAFMFGGSIPLRTALGAADLRPSGKYANLAVAAILFLFSLLALWIMVSVGPEGAAVTLDVPLPFISEAAERLLKGAIFYGVFGLMAAMLFAGALISLNNALPAMGRTAVIAMVAPVVGLMCWVAIEYYVQTVPPHPPVMFVSFDRRFPSDEYLSRPQGREIVPRPGRMGTGLFVGGNGDWIDIDAPRGYDTAHGLTLEFWMKRENWINPYGKGARLQTIASIDVEREWKGRPDALPIYYAPHGVASPSAVEELGGFSRAS